MHAVQQHFHSDHEGLQPDPGVVVSQRAKSRRVSHEPSGSMALAWHAATV